MFQRARPDVVLDVDTIDEMTNGSYKTTIAHFKRKLELLKEQGVEVEDVDQAIRKAVEPHYQLLLLYRVPAEIAEQCIQELIVEESEKFMIPVRPEEVSQ
jgi:hypothetical protein